MGPTVPTDRTGHTLGALNAAVARPLGHGANDWPADDYLVSRMGRTRVV